MLHLPENIKGKYSTSLIISQHREFAKEHIKTLEIQMWVVPYSIKDFLQLSHSLMPWFKHRAGQGCWDEDIESSEKNEIEILPSFSLVKYQNLIGTLLLQYCSQPDTTTVAEIVINDLKISLFSSLKKHFSLHNIHRVLVYAKEQVFGEGVKTWALRKQVQNLNSTSYSLVYISLVWKISRW